MDYPLDMKFFFLVILFVSGFLLGGCNSGKRPDPNPGDDRIVNLHANLLIFHERSLIMKRDSSNLRKGRDSIFAAYHATQEEYEKALEWYKRDIESWKAFNEQVVKQLEELQRKSSHGKDSVGQISAKK